MTIKQVTNIRHCSSCSVVIVVVVVVVTVRFQCCVGFCSHNAMATDSFVLISTRLSHSNWSLFCVHSS